MKSDINKYEIDKIFKSEITSEVNLTEFIVLDLIDIIKEYTIAVKFIDLENTNYTDEVEILVEAYKLLYQIYKDGK